MINLDVCLTKGETLFWNHPVLDRGVPWNSYWGGPSFKAQCISNESWFRRVVYTCIYIYIYSYKYIYARGISSNIGAPVYITVFLIVCSPWTFNKDGKQKKIMSWFLMEEFVTYKLNEHENSHIFLYTINDICLRQKKSD